MNLSRKLIAAWVLLVGGVIVIAATGQNRVGCGIRAGNGDSHGAGSATVEFRIDRMSGESITVRRVAAVGSASPSAVRTRITRMGATAECRSTGGRNAHFVIEPIGPAPNAEFQGEGPVRVVVISAGVQLASGMLNAPHDSEVKLAW